ncbi:hypothetical protein NLJ89_g4029 [Agrocybe chaxingu]|uniref:CcmS related domain-containing protein n=1 Tax=Agrocybe chaxingu TaxID=84603 RepID=A0A9W8MY06_9AGAR|nr:hypothetical protein NLJ89_g4029 [Agrocybe chaxingu]
MPPRNAMGKKQKGKQKVEEKPAPPSESVPATKGVNVTSMPPAEPSQQSRPPDPQAASWGASGGDTWAASAGSTWPQQETGGNGWGVLETTQQVHDWDHTDSLLHPPQPNGPNILPTIPETHSGHFSQNGAHSSDNRSQDQYTDNWDNNHEPRSQNWDGTQTRTLTPTAAASAVGSPRPDHVISLADAAVAAEKEIQKQQKFSSASEAAKRFEESRSNIIASPMATQTTTALAAQTIAHKPMSSASAAAAAYEANMRPRKSPAAQAQSVTSQGKTTWMYPKPFLPGAHQPAHIPVDTSWTMTGGNTWSNKHRTAKGASTGNWAPPSLSGWDEQLHQFRQAEAAHQARRVTQARQQPARPTHHKHHSHPGHPGQHQRQPAQQGPSWQGWGKDGWGQSEETESDSEAETLNGWGAGAWGQGGGGGGGDSWGQSGGTSWGQGGGNAGGENAADGWAQAGATEWGHTTGGWGEPQPPAKEGRHGQKRGRGRAPDRKAAQDDAWGQAGAGGAGDWGVGGGGDNRGRQGKDGWKPASAWDEQPGDSWGQQGQQGQQADGWGTAGGDAWGQGQGQSGWGQNKEWGITGDGGGGGWGGHATSNAEWGGDPRQSKVPLPDAAGSRNVLSPQQRSQILNSLLTTAQNQPAKGQQHGQASGTGGKHQSHPQSQQHHKHAQRNWEPWEAPDAGWGSDESEGEYDPNRRVRFSPKASELWGGSPRSVPSKTLAHAQAQQGIMTTLINDASNPRFVDSRGAGLAYVANAFFGNSRLARERVYWMFPENKDERVAAMIQWVQKMSFNLATYGLMKFLETRERGALFVNAVFRMSQHPHEPAFDWLTFNQLQGTMDKTLQASVAFCDPSKITLVFVFLPSQSGNSVAIWRRKVNVPDAARLKYQAEINAITKTLRTGKDYPVLVDEVPKPKTPAKSGTLRKSLASKPNAKAKAMATKLPAKSDKDKKRKWWKFFFS